MRVGCRNNTRDNRIRVKRVHLGRRARGVHDDDDDDQDISVGTYQEDKTAWIWEGSFCGEAKFYYFILTGLTGLLS